MNIVRIGLLVVVLLFCQCTEYLDVKNNNSLSVPKKLEDLQMLLDNHNFMNAQRTPVMSIYFSDDYFLSETRLNAVDPMYRAPYLWQTFDYKFANDWSQAYLPIYTSNFCLEMLEKIEKTPSNQQLWNQVKGSAMFFKAYYYLNLLWVYSKVYDPQYFSDKAIVLRNASDFNVKSEFYTQKECYDEVLKLAMQALEMLPAFSTPNSRPSKASTHGLLARAYLSMRQYELALKHSQEFLDIYSKIIDYNKPEDGIKIDHTLPFSRNSIEIVFYSEANNFLNLSFNKAFIDSTLVASFDQADLRRRAFLSKNGKYYNFKGVFTHTVQTRFSGLTTSEMVLSEIECLARLGMIPIALEKFNNFRRFRFDKTKHFPKFTSDDPNVVLDMILLERRKELMFRGLRWMDIKRLRREGRQILPTRFWNGKRYSLDSHPDGFVPPLPFDLDNFL